MQKILDIVDILKSFIENLKMCLGCVWDNLIFLDKNLFNSVQVCAYCTDSNSTPSALFRTDIYNNYSQEGICFVPYVYRISQDLI